MGMAALPGDEAPQHENFLDKLVPEAYYASA